MEAGAGEHETIECPIVFSERRILYSNPYFIIVGGGGREDNAEREDSIEKGRGKESEDSGEREKGQCGDSYIDR
jgi:hypothetical protein